MADERRLRDLYDSRMAECRRLQNEIDNLSVEMTQSPQREAELRPVFLERAREWQQLWAETRSLTLQLEALLRRDISNINKEMKHWRKREH